MPLPHAQVAAPTTGSRLVSVDGRVLPLTGVHVSADAGGGLVRVVVEQRFFNTHVDPLTATYQLPLPADGAVVGFSFLIGERRIVGEIDRKQRARQRFEQAVAQGRTAAILDQDRSSLFTQEIGNIPPGTEITAEITIEQPLTWRPGCWEWRFPTVVAPRFLGSLTPDPDRVSVDILDGPLATTAAVTLQIRDAMTGAACSTSHELQGEAEQVSLPMGTPLDRDIVIRWPVAAPTPTTNLELSEADGEAHGLLTIVPPVADLLRPVVPRDLILLLDTSGSMGGRPLSQAKALGRALIAGMTDEDRLEMISFAARPERWHAGPVAMDAAGRAQARRWLERQRARGGTQMREGIIEALRPLRTDAQRQVVLVSDGLIGFEKQVISAVLSTLPVSSRVHTVGVGSGVNRSLTGPVARAGGGVEVVIGLDESPDEAAEILLSRTSRPEIVDLALSGTALVEHAPRRLPDLFAGAPVRISLHLKPGTLVLSGRTVAGPWQTTLEIPAVAGGRAVVVTRFAREKVEDLELRVAAGGDRTAIDAEIEAIGLRAGISTRLTSWIATTAGVMVDPMAPTRAEQVPHARPYGMSVESAGLRRPLVHSTNTAFLAMPPSGAMGAGAPPPALVSRKSRRSRSLPASRSVPPAPVTEQVQPEVQPGLDADEAVEDLDAFSAPKKAPLVRAPRQLFDAVRALRARRKPTSSKATPPVAEAPRVLVATVRLHADGQLILEITLSAPLDWAPLSTSLGAPLGGTRAGRYGAGQRIRLVLSLADGVAVPAEVTVDSSGAPLTLMVRST